MPASADPATIRTWVAEARADLADRLAALPAEAWDADSLCAGWKVRDVVGHLVFLAEGTRPSVFREALKQAPRTVDRALARIARREGSAEPADLIWRLRDAGGGGFVMPGFSPAVALGEVFVHGSDVLRPTEGEPRPADERTLLVAETYRKVGFAFGSRRTAKIRFTADDAGWSVGPPDGPAAHGPGEAVLLALAGRPEGVADLTGPGADRLAR